jgi:predicted metalloprotease with PDZ domain
MDRDDLLMEVSCNTRLVDVDGEGDDPERGEEWRRRRPEFISHTFVKKSVAERLGLKLKAISPTIMAIDRANKDSLLAQSPLQAGDKLISINTQICCKMTSEQICELLTKSTGIITIVVHNEGGVSDLVESMTTKESVEEKCGLGFRTDANNDLTIYKIFPDGKFSGSLLNPSDKVIFVNGVFTGCGTTPLEAANLVRSAPKNVTVVAKPGHERGIVVAEVAKRKCAQCFQLLVMKSTMWANKGGDATGPLTRSELNNQRLGKCCAALFLIMIVSFFVVKSVT